MYEADWEGDNEPGPGCIHHSYKSKSNIIKFAHTKTIKTFHKKLSYH